jgi:hypothetical protein
MGGAALKLINMIEQKEDLSPYSQNPSALKNIRPKMLGPKKMVLYGALKFPDIEKYFRLY